MHKAEVCALMRRALDLAENGMYSASPNPRVGCVFARGGIVFAEGWHERAGGAHAEAVALAQTNGDLRGADVFVNLEPCAHEGKTPSCAKMLARARPQTVAIAALDPNPQTAGKGAQILRHAGIAVTVLNPKSEIAKRAFRLNIGFYSRMIRKRPWLRLKIAASLDGKTALANGKSKWLTSLSARRDAHRWRARSCAILTGVGTAEKDNPLLTVRHITVSRQPLRVLVDSALRASPRLQMFSGGAVLIATAAAAPKKNTFGKETKITSLPDKTGKTNLHSLLRLLAEMEINEVTVEAGRKLCGAFWSEGLVDEIVAYTAPRVLGDGALPMFAAPPPKDLRKAPGWKAGSAKVFPEGDVVVVYEKKGAENFFVLPKKRGGR